MIRYILGRILSILLTFTVVSVIVFLMMHSVPGGPFDGNDMPVSDAVKAKLNWGKIDAPRLAKTALWSATAADNQFGVLQGLVVDDINDFIQAKAWR